MIYGYARKSPGGHEKLPPQIAALREAGAGKIFSEVASGAKSDRRGLMKAIAALEAGDVLLVTRGDRAARSVRDMLNLLESVRAKGAGFLSLSEPWADTRDQTPMGKLMQTIMAGFAEFERSLILTRTAEGRARAVAAGGRMGRKPKLTPHQQQEAAQRVAAGEAVREVARSYNVSHSTISRLSGR